MIESNTTHVDQTHRIFISSTKPIADRTGLYVIILLSFLLFILIYYLVYNFISFKRYRSSRKKKCAEKHLSTEPQLNRRSPSYEELIIPSHQIPLETSTSLSIQKSSKQSSPSSLSYPITSQLVSDL
jgi:hypothetical protein